MLRVLGAILVIGGSGLLGLSAVSGLTLRVRTLRQLAEALNLMRSEIRFTLAPIPRLLETLGMRRSGAVGAFFADCARQMETLGERSFAELWTQALRRSFSGLLNNEELLALEALGDVLGRYDAEEQVGGVEYAIGRLSSFCTAAEQERSRFGRVYGAMSLLCGVAAVIILI